MILAKPSSPDSGRRAFGCEKQRGKAGILRDEAIPGKNDVI
jgi:hypothetical protein